MFPEAVVPAAIPGAAVVAADAAVGSVAGLALGRVTVRYVKPLLYAVSATDAGALALPGVVILMAALVAALPAVVRAIRIDPAAALLVE